MTRRAYVLNNGELAGLLEKTDESTYRFQYLPEYVSNQDGSAISLSFPKTDRVYESDALFPFFFGLLSEGVNRQTQCRLLKIDENDHFSLLLKTATSDTIGAITLKEI